MNQKPLRGLVELINSILSHFANMTDVNMSVAIYNALESIGEYTCIDRCYLNILNKDTNTLLSIAEWTSDSILKKYEPNINLNFNEQEHIYSEISSGNTIHIPYVEALIDDSLFNKNKLLSENIQSLILIPLKSIERVYGYIGFESIREARAWNDEEVLLLNSLANIFVSGLIRNETYTHLSDKEHQFRLLIQHSSDLIIILNKEYRFTFVTPSSKNLLLTDSDLLLGREYLSFVHPEDQKILIHIFNGTSSLKEIVLPDHRLKDSSNNWRWFSGKVSNLLNEKTIQGLILNVHDITLRKEAEDEVLHQAQHDPLTGLANRNLMMDKLIVATKRAKRLHRQIGLIFIDLDHFKTINDSLGHDIGDSLLQDVSSRLIQSINSTDTVARFGGDEYVILIEPNTSNGRDVIVNTATRILDIFNTPFTVNGRSRMITASAGALITDGNEDPHNLLRDADAAMYQAKSKGRAQLQFFDASLQAQLLHRVELAQDLRNCEKRQELLLYYQPIYNSDKKMVSMEALVRWQHPIKGLIPPIDFISVAEDTGAIIHIGLWVLREAVSQIHQWKKKIHDWNIPIAVNLSAKQLTMSNLVDVIKNILHEYRVEPHLLIIELTESSIMEDPQSHKQVLNKISNLGCSIAIDDFGTGYSSMAYLKDLPVNTLKIDKSFIKDIMTAKRDERVVAAMINLATELGMSTVAEGVETEEQMEILKSLHCNKYQGYLLHRPTPASNIEKGLL